MPYQISSLKLCKPVAGTRYLFDANVWLMILDTNFSTRHSPPYENFFNDVYSKKDGIDVSIVMPSLLLSEVLNRLMNDIYYCEFLRSNPIPAGMKKHEHHKHVYRCSEQYAQDLAAATS